MKVKGRGKDVIVTTYAFLDSGSTSSWCSEILAKRLGVVEIACPGFLVDN